MKRYLRVTSYGIFAEDEIAKQNLADMLKSAIDVLVATENGIYFDPESNEWKKIQVP